MAFSAHFPVNTLALKRGGLVKAVRDRASALAADGSLDAVVIDVLQSQVRLATDVEELKIGGHLHRDVQVVSVLSALDESTEELREPRTIEEEPMVTSYLADDSGLNFRLFRHGLYERYVRFDEGGVPVLIDYFSPARQRTRREEFDGTGRLCRVLEYQQGSVKATVQRHIGRDGGCFLTIWHKPGDDAWGSAFLHGPALELKSSGALYKRAYDRLLAHEEQPAICSEFRENLSNLPKENLDDVVRAVHHPNLLKIVTVHSNHLQEPYTRGSGVSRNWKRTLDHLDDFDAIVALTPAQKEDLAAEFGHRDMIHVIGQVAPAAHPRLTVDPFRLVLVARTHPKKRVDEALRVYAHVRESEPQAILEIFGFGYQDAEESKIQGLIEELGIKEGVRFMPFTNDPRSIYGNACATLLTSASEGFPLILLESMSQGVPVMAYDANYGPRDVITDGVNGYLVPFGEHQQLAERVLEAMRDPDLRDRLGENAQTRIQGFGPEAFTRSWLDLLSMAPRPMRGQGKTVGPVVASAHWNDRSLVLESAVGVPVGTVLEFRDRSSGEAILRSELTPQGWNGVLPGADKGALLDAYLIDNGSNGPRRVHAGQFDNVEGAGWRLYSTANGFLSAKAIG